MRRKKVHVGFVVHNLDVGGLEKVVLSLINNLDRDEFEPFLICLAGAGRMAADAKIPDENRLVLEKQEGVRIPLLGVSVDTHLFSSIRRFVKDKQIDVLHAHNLAPLIYAGVSTRLIPMRRRPRLVYSDHNQLFNMAASRTRRLQWYLKLADEVVAVSADLQRNLTEQLKADPGKVRVVYNGVDGRRFAVHDRAKVRRALSIPDADFVVGTAVVLSEHKGIDYLLDAAPQVLARAPGTRFVIAGDGPHRAVLEAKTRKMGLSDRVMFLGHRHDIPEVVSSFDVYVLPSVSEGLPLALLEALAIGNPILCTRVGGNPEIVEDGVNGYLVPPRDSHALADRIVLLRSNPKFLEAVRARNVQKFADRFTLRAMVDAHARLFSELAGRVAALCCLVSVWA